MRILFFAHLKTAVGCASADIHCDGQVDADTLWQQLLAHFPALSPYRRSVRLACNGTYATFDTHFSDTDEIALIPPVSGG
jgi:molybdopterin synthase catalytic subunit/molybdopterin synthase sulfur carrier subunit